MSNFFFWRCRGHYPGALNFFQVGVCGPDFRSVGLLNCYLPLKRGACELKISKLGGLWTENFPILGLVSWKFPNLGAWELKFGRKLRLLRLKFQNFLKRGSCELTLLLAMWPLRTAGAWKGVFRAAHPRTPFLGVPPGDITSFKMVRHLIPQAVSFWRYIKHPFCVIFSISLFATITHASCGSYFTEFIT